MEYMKPEFKAKLKNSCCRTFRKFMKDKLSARDGVRRNKKNLKQI